VAAEFLVRIGEVSKEDVLATAHESDRSRWRVEMGFEGRVGRNQRGERSSHRHHLSRLDEDGADGARDGRDQGRVELRLALGPFLVEGGALQVDRRQLRVRTRTSGRDFEFESGHFARERELRAPRRFDPRCVLEGGILFAVARRLRQKADAFEADAPCRLPGARARAARSAP
jgi:hypothetical protein